MRIGRGFALEVNVRHGDGGRMVECVAEKRIDAATTRTKVAQGGQDRQWEWNIEALDNDHKGPGRREPTESMEECKNVTERLRDTRMRYSNGTPTEGEGRGAQGEKCVFPDQKNSTFSSCFTLVNLARDELTEQETTHPMRKCTPVVI
jgi:hypothetical protein